MDDLLTAEQGALLLRVARLVIGKKLGRKEKIPAPEDAALQRTSGTFVTLKLEGQLRGCIGNLEPAGSIADGIERNVQGPKSGGCGGHFRFYRYCARRG